MRRCGVILGQVHLRWTNLVTLMALPACPAALAPFCASWHWSIDLLACFPVQALGALTVAAIVHALLRKFWQAGGFALFAIIAVGATVPGWCQSPPATAPGEFVSNVDNTPRIRVLALNLLRSNDNGHAAALAVIRNQQPDVIFCGEFTPDWQQFLEAQLQDYPHRCSWADPGYFGAAMFSRWPLAAAEILPLAHRWAPAVRAIVKTPLGAIGVLGVHTPPPGIGRSRVAERDRALAAIPKALAGLPARRIVLGDFNVTPWNQAFAKLRADTGLSAGTTRDWHPTWPSNWPLPLRIPIDHVLVAGDLVVESATVGSSFGSDHLPLAAVVALSEN